MTEFEKFKAFVKEQPADRGYDYLDTGWCALAQFARVEHPDASYVSASASAYVADNTMVQVINLDDEGAWDRISALINSRTFGELSSKLEAM